MWTVAIWFFIFMFAINGMLLYLDSVLPAYSLVSPFTNQTLILPSQPAVNTTLTNVTSGTPGNATGGAGVASIWELGTYAWNQTIFVVNLLTGGFIWQALAAFGIPALACQVIQGIMAIFMVLTLLHFWRGIL